MGDAREPPKIHDRGSTLRGRGIIQLSTNLDHSGAHARTAGIFPMCLLNFLKPEGSLDRHEDVSGPKPFKEQLQIRHEVLRRAAEAEEGGSFAKPEEQILGQ